MRIHWRNLSEFMPSDIYSADALWNAFCVVTVYVSTASDLIASIGFLVGNKRRNPRESVGLMKNHSYRFY